MKFWLIAVGSTLIPLILLTRWAMTMQRGAGPQGGEILFLGYVALWLWMVAASLVTTVICTSSLSLSGFVRFALIPFGVLAGLAILLGFIVHFLNHASLSELTDAQSRVENILAFVLQAVIVGVNLWVLIRKM